MNWSSKNIIEIVNALFDLIEMYGFRQYDEHVTIVQHMQQAAHLSEVQGEDEEFIIAAFLHDIGIFCNPFIKKPQVGGFIRKDHEMIGAAFLSEQGFSERICDLVTSQLDAKRYVKTKEFRYRKKSTGDDSLFLAPDLYMTRDELSSFEKSELFNEAIRLRRIDEAARDPKVVSHKTMKYRSMITSHLTSRKHKV